MEMPKLEKLADNPWALVAFGALAGVWLGSHGARSENAESRGLVMGALGAIALKVVRDLALGEMTKIAAKWIDVPAETGEPKPTYAS